MLTYAGDYSEAATPLQQLRERVAKGADLRVLVKIEELRGLNSVRLPRYIR
jgi:hypothetical protein